MNFNLLLIKMNNRKQLVIWNYKYKVNNNDLL